MDDPRPDRATRHEFLLVVETDRPVDRAEVEAWLCAGIIDDTWPNLLLDDGNKASFERCIVKRPHSQ